MRNDPPAGSFQCLTRPVYIAADVRDYEPPDIFRQVREPVPLPRADVKDQEAHRRGAIFPADARAPETAELAPAAVGAGSWPSNWLERGGDHRPGPRTRDYIRAVLADLPGGVGLTTLDLRSRLPGYLNEATVRRELGRLRIAGEADMRYLLKVGGTTQSGKVCEWRRAQPDPWGPLPPGTCLPGQRPRLVRSARRGGAA